MGAQAAYGMAGTSGGSGGEAKRRVKILLDTTVLIDLLRGRGDGVAMVQSAAQSRSELVTSAVNVAEVHAGLRSGEEARANVLLSSLEVLPVTKTIAAMAGTFIREWSKKGRTLTLPDMLVAATALEHNTILATTNVKDFPMPEITLFQLT